jgi:tetratricopeptide (TPR) repeat protein
MTWTRHLAVAIGYFILIVLPAFGETTWEAANRAYANGKSEEAKVDYLQMVRAGKYSADLFYNLGNVWFKLGDHGRSILNYDRALLLNPRLGEARFNKRTAFKIVGNSELPDFRERMEAYADYFPIVASVAFWVLAFAFYPAWRNTGRFTIFLRFLCIVAGFTFVCGVAICVWIGSGSKNPDRALVVEAAADLKYGPAVSARSVESLQIGDEVRLISERGDWTFCRVTTGNLGWIPTRKIERIIP